MEIIIGRDKETGQLRITMGQQSKLVGTPGSVPDYVSRQHVKITTDDSGGLVITNLKPNNVTYVNGLSVDSKHVTESDRVEMGPTRYPLDWTQVLGMMPVMADIRPLEAVWTNYNNTKKQNQIKLARLNAIRGGTSIITMGAIAMGLMGSRGGVQLAAYGIAVLISLFFFIKSLRDADKMPQKNEEIERNFRATYVCPNPKCRHFLGNKPFDLLMQDKQCPYCKAQYRK